MLIWTAHINLVCFHKSSPLEKVCFSETRTVANGEYLPVYFFLVVQIAISPDPIGAILRASGRACSSAITLSIIMFEQSTIISIYIHEFIANFIYNLHHPPITTQLCEPYRNALQLVKKCTGCISLKSQSPEGLYHSGKFSDYKDSFCEKIRNNRWGAAKRLHWWNGSFENKTWKRSELRHGNCTSFVCQGTISVTLFDYFLLGTVPGKGVRVNIYLHRLQLRTQVSRSGLTIFYSWIFTSLVETSGWHAIAYGAIKSALFFKTTN